jgi:hypothetical protein
MFMRYASALLLASLAIAGCSSGPKNTPNTQETTKPAAKPAAQPLTGRLALGKMAMPAHMWAGDVQPIHLESQPTTDSDGTDGKASVWRSTWASASKRSTKSFTWSDSDADDAPARGIMPGGEDTYSPSNSSMQAFDMGFLKIDSDAALKTAKDKLKGKQKDAKPIRFSLSFDRRQNQLAWRIAPSGAPTIDVDATTGKYVRTEH